MKDYDIIKIAKAIVPLILLFLDSCVEKDWRGVKIKSSYPEDKKRPTKMKFNEWAIYIFSEIKKLSCKAEGAGVPY